MIFALDWYLVIEYTAYQIDHGDDEKKELARAGGKGKSISKLL